MKKAGVLRCWMIESQVIGLRENGRADQVFGRVYLSPKYLHRSRVSASAAARNEAGMNIRDPGFLHLPWTCIDTRKMDFFFGSSTTGSQ